jgi:response regulator RpfG family c-di-GMP phosphodiesterase
MSRISWLYIYFTLGSAVALCLWVLYTLPQPAAPWPLFVALTLLTTFLTLYTVQVSTFKSFEGSTISVVAALFLLPPWLFIIHTIVAYTVKWLKEYWFDKGGVRPLYLHLYNLATSLIGGAGTYLVVHYTGFTTVGALTVPSFLQVILLCFIHVMLQQLTLGGWLIWVRHVPWREVNIWAEGIRLEVPQACMGYLAAEIYLSEPLLALFMVAPIVLTYQASLLPKLQEEAMNALQRFAAELQEKNQTIEQRNEDLFVTLAKVFDARDPYVGGHAAQVAAYAVAIGKAMDLAPERIEILRQSAYLHDIGKIAIPDAILHKPDRLTESEYQIVKKHCDIGADFVETSAALKHLAPYIRYHHERWDGQGYPSGLSGDAIPLEARILNICDSVEAMASDRPYHRALSLAQITEEVKQCAGRQFDPQVVDAFIQITDKVGAHFIVNSARDVAKRHQDDRPNSNWSISRLAQVYGLVPS